MGQIQPYLPFIAMFVVIFFFMIMPAQKRAKKEKEFESGLKNGDKVITKSGIHGRVSELTDTTVVIETMAGKIKMERSAISPELTSKIQTSEVKK